MGELVKISLPLETLRRSIDPLLPWRWRAMENADMKTIKMSLWGLLVLLTVLWLAAEPGVFQTTGYFTLRANMVQHSGVIAMGCMSVAMILALRPRWPEAWFGGLDKMYRLHKWLGIAALVFAVIHWLWAQGTKWAVGWGWQNLLTPVAYHGEQTMKAT